MTATKPVLFFHGFWGQASDFDFVQKNLTDHLPHLSLKSWDYTKDPQLGPEVFLSDWGDSFFAALNSNTVLKPNLGLQLNDQPIQAVGYSQGGRLLLQAFQRAPDRFEKLVLISSHPGLQNFEEREARLKNDRQWAQAFREENWQSLSDRWNSQAVFRGGVEKPRMENDFNRETLALCLENWSLAHQPDFRDLIRKHNSKIHVIVGSEDSKYVELYQQAGIRVQKAKGAAHRVPSDQPLILVEILKSILT